MIMPFALTYAELKALKPCEDDFVKVIAILGGAAAWGGRLITAADARAAGVSMDHVVWVASRLALSNSEIERRLQHWNCDCAMRVLAIFEKQFPGDGRPRAAIEAGRHFADGLIGAAEWAAARDAARNAAWSAAERNAARAAGWRAARAAARAAGWSAASAAARYAAWSAASAAARYAEWDAAGAAAWSAAWSPAGAAGWNTAAWAAARAAAARGAEQDWQFGRLCEWMSDAPIEAVEALLEISGDDR